MNQSSNSLESGYNAPKIVASGLSITDIKDVELGIIQISGSLGGIVQKNTLKPYLKLYESIVTDETGSLRVIWFNRDSLKYLDHSKIYIFLGKLEHFNGVKSLISPIFTPIDNYKKWVKILSKRQL